MKTGIHGNYFQDVQVNCICGATFTVNTTIPGPIKVETCNQCHPAFNKDKVIKKVIKGRMEKFLEKEKKMAGIKGKKK
ncbi:MAG: 50S ribosomal protein L31 [candidate division SR1 bacterium]|nr:50S ribosomal protein L31 [candidate division SR1 bacterium]